MPDLQLGRCLGFLNRELAEASGVAAALPPSEESTSTLDYLSKERHLSIASMFVRQDKPSRAVDLLTVVEILGREADSGDAVCGFHFILPDTLRASTGAVRGGLTMFDVEVCPWSPGMRGIAAVFYRVRRGRRTDRLLHSVKNLVDGQEALRATSAAYGLTASVLERIDLLRQTGDAEILLGGSLALADRMAGVGAGYAALVETGLPEPLAIANRQLVLTHSGDTKPVRNASHVVFTIGGRPDSLSEILARIHAQVGGVVRFRECLLQLLDEGLPCRPIDELASRYLDICGRSKGERATHEIADALRRLESINRVLTRDASDWSLYPLGEDVTREILQHIWQEGHLSYLALPEELTADILRAVRDRIHEQSGTGKQVILVQDWRVRRFVRRIVEQLFPSVKVVAEDELAAIEPRPRRGPCISVA